MLSFLVALPGVGVCFINAQLKEKEEHEHFHRPEFKPYAHLRLRTKVDSTLLWWMQFFSAVLSFFLFMHICCSFNYIVICLKPNSSTNSTCYCSHIVQYMLLVMCEFCFSCLHDFTALSLCLNHFKFRILFMIFSYVRWVMKWTICVAWLAADHDGRIVNGIGESSWNWNVVSHFEYNCIRTFYPDQWHNSIVAQSLRSKGHWCDLVSLQKRD